MSVDDARSPAKTVPGETDRLDTSWATDVSRDTSEEFFARLRKILAEWAPVNSPDLAVRRRSREEGKAGPSYLDAPAESVVIVRVKVNAEIFDWVASEGKSVPDEVAMLLRHYANRAEWWALRSFSVERFSHMEK